MASADPKQTETETETETELLVNIYESEVVENPSLYRLSSAELLARVEKDIVSEINMFSKLMHPNIARLMYFTTGSIEGNDVVEGIVHMEVHVADRRFVVVVFLFCSQVPNCFRAA